MMPFYGTHQTRLDAKGRTSMPAPFRAALRSAEGGSTSVVLRPSHNHDCIEGWPLPAFEALAPQLDRLEMFSEDQDFMAAALYAEAWPVDPDKDGRITLPESLVRHAGLTDTVSFMGAGRIFLMWEPEAGQRYAAAARERVRERRATLPGRTA